MKAPRTLRNLPRFLGALVAAAALTLALGVGSASASFGFEEFDGEALTEAGKAATQASSHPYEVTTTINFNTDEKGELEGNVRDINVELPAGFVGNALAAAKCTAAELTVLECPLASQVGVLRVITPFPYTTYPVYSMIPPPDAPAQFAANILLAEAIISPQVRTGGDYGLTTSLTNTPSILPIFSSELTFWGVPASSAHDTERYPCLAFFGFPTGESCPSGVPNRPFLTLPAACSGPQTTTLHANSWDEPAFQTASFVSHDPEGNPVGIDGCSKVPFGATLDTEPESHSAASPSGLQVNVHIPQSEASDGLASSPLKDAKVTLPEGVSINPAAADGLGACSEAQIGLDNANPAACPGSAKVGTVKIETPLLEKPMQGSVYLAEQNRNPFGSLAAVYLVAEGSGVTIKQAGRVDLNPSSGQLVTTFDNNPQLPFSDLELSFFGGAHAALQMPDACGTYTTHYELTPWSGTAPVSGQSSFQIDEGCDTGGFNPKLSAGTTNPVAGAHSPFVFDTTRNDGEQNLAGIDVNLPEGLTAKLAGIPLCGDADAGSGNCPAASQVGVVNAAVGAGSSPLWVPQAGKEATAVYLAGPYKGAPYSIVAKVPAQAGPFDLGTVAVRSKVNVDPETAQVSVQSDPLPQILQGIPISYREVQVNVDKPDFMLNPTSCEAMSIGSAISSDTGAIAHPSSRFQVGSCGDLGFSPKLAIRLFGPTKRGGHPRLRAVVTPKPGEANIGRAAVTLPRSEFLDQAHIKTICTRVQSAANACPAGSVYGYAKAWTPLLDQPLQGPVYLRSSEHKLPDLVADLNGQIHIVLDGRIDSVHKGIRTTFEGVPDAPVSRFVLNMQGGKKGLLINSRDICAHKYRANARLRGQNGRLANTRPLVRNGACGAQRKHKRHHRRGR